ncbi:type II CAAX prenyl endopeptidase Rce1 family protein [Bacillus sp. FJAT-29937]|uniref:type II CAAX prenyl endopeptidase Rce1 family protein n=1 Tax=Bacillus sp. FJAT-29937 TaxID=1720553 RepID=UPI000832765C|nr:CPBP family glutamic-type intramembrane protease [Bacillus sp. FJAT-29937]
MIKDFIKKVNSHPILDSIPFRRAVLYSLLIPGMLISINEGAYHAIWLTLVCLLIGYKDIKPFVNFKQYKLLELLKISGITIVVSLLFSIAGLKIMSLFGVMDPQGLKDLVLTNEEYLNKLEILPFIAVGEEFFKLLMFLALFSLITVGTKNTRILIATLIAAFIFGHLHVFSYEFTAGIPIMFGVIPTFYLMLYYRSIIPLIIEHFFADFYSFTGHTVFGDLFVQIVSIVFMICWFGWMFKTSSLKKKPVS